MSFQMALRKRLRDDADILALVGDRVYTGFARQDGTEPYIVINEISTVDIFNHMRSSTSVIRERYQIDVYHETKSILDSLKILIIKRLNLVGYQNWTDPDDAKVFKIYVCYMDSANDTFDSEDDGSSEGTYKTSIDFMIKRNLESTTP